MGWKMTIRNCLLSIAGVAALAAAAPASANVEVINYQYAPQSIYGGISVASLGFMEGGPTGRFSVDARDTVSGALSSFQTFCIDVTKGFFTYREYAVTGAAAAVPDATKRSQLAALLINGNPLIDSAGTVAESEEIAAAIGLAVWEIVYETGVTGYDVTTNNFSVYGDFLQSVSGRNVDGRANGYLANVLNGVWEGNPARLGALVAVNGDTQNQIFLTGAGVPEPSTWLQMLAGFAFIGSALRRRKRKAATA